MLAERESRKLVVATKRKEGVKDTLSTGSVLAYAEAINAGKTG